MVGDQRSTMSNVSVGASPRNRKELDPEECLTDSMKKNGFYSIRRDEKAFSRLPGRDGDPNEEKRLC
jgi:hypothetical protein